MGRTRRVMAVVVTVVLTLGGCTTVRRDFPLEDPDHVWQALVAVARTPDYENRDPAKRWTVVENDVWADEPSRRIEIYRELDRVLRRPGTTPLREQRAWRFRVTMAPGAPPSATFVSRGWGVPAQARLAANEYFFQVMETLAGGTRIATDEARPRDDAITPSGDDAGAPPEGS